jgi:biopolymer transport protein ExbD
MGGVDVGEGGGKHKRARNADINMIPFIDLLMVTVAFLLITAVWVTNSVVKANAQVPGPASTNPIDITHPEPVLHLTDEADQFTLAWKVGNDVVSEVKVEKPSNQGDTIKYDDLAAKIENEWHHNGRHQDAADRSIDQAVLHTDNRTSFKEIVAVLDALYATKREICSDSDCAKKSFVPAFNMTFSAH